MKKLFAILAFALLANPAFAAIARVNQGTSGLGVTCNGSGANTVACTLSQAGLNGNTLVAVITSSHGNSILSVAATNCSMSKATSSDVNLNTEVWYCVISGGNSGTTVTATFHVSETPNSWMTVTEWSGIKTTTPVDQSATANNNGTTVTIGAVTTTVANTLVIGVAIAINNVSGACNNNSFTALNTADITRLVTGYQIVSATGTYSCSFSQGSGVAWDSSITSLQQASSATSTIQRGWWF